MLIVKGGISREIDEKNLQVYLDKGYKSAGVVGDDKNSSPPVTKEKPLNKMTTSELEARALEIGIDISDCKNNAERAERIQGALEVIQKGGE